MSLPAVLDPRGSRAERRELRRWLALQALAFRKPVEAARLLARLGDPDRVRRALEAAGARPPPETAGRALRRLARIGALGVPLGSAAYPTRIARLADPATLLLVRGDPGVLARRAVAVVGARAASVTGRAVARRLAAELAELGLVVVSGLAQGVDAQAHEGALEAGGLTVAVQGCGPDRVYPAAHVRLAARIAARGALVSELPPGVPPLPHHFPLRNRLIAALAECTVVVEARARSGSLSTARHALDQGAEVLAVPGPVTAPQSVGTNRLLRDGAAPCLDVEDVLRALGLPPRPPPARADGDRDEHPVIAALHDAPATPDELARRLGMTPEGLAETLVELELAGRLALDGDGCLKLL